MSRLPVPGKDIGTWGIILNDFLNQSHNADGSIKNNVVTPAALAGDIPQTKIENLQTDIASKANTSDLAPVATSGTYTDLTDKPTIPSTLSNLSDDSTHRLVTDTEKSTWSGKQEAGSYLVAADIAGKEDSLNKSTDIITDATSDTKYPSVKSVKAYVDPVSSQLSDIKKQNIFIPTIKNADNYKNVGSPIISDPTSIISMIPTIDSGGIPVHCFGTIVAKALNGSVDSNANLTTIYNDLGSYPMYPNRYIPTDGDIFAEGKWEIIDGHPTGIYKYSWSRANKTLNATVFTWEDVLYMICDVQNMNDLRYGFKIANTLGEANCDANYELYNSSPFICAQELVSEWYIVGCCTNMNEYEVSTGNINVYMPLNKTNISVVNAPTTIAMGTDGIGTSGRVVFAYSISSVKNTARDKALGGLLNWKTALMSAKSYWKSLFQTSNLVLTTNQKLNAKVSIALQQIASQSYNGFMSAGVPNWYENYLRDTGWIIFAMAKVNTSFAKDLILWFKDVTATNTNSYRLDKVPITGYNNTDNVCSMLMGIAEYYKQTGDIDTVIQMTPFINNLIVYAQSNFNATDGHILAIHAHDYWDDYVPEIDTSLVKYESMVDVLWIYALEQIAPVFIVLDDLVRSTFCTDTVALLRTHLEEYRRADGGYEYAIKTDGSKYTTVLATPSNIYAAWLLNDVQCLEWLRDPMILGLSHSDLSYSLAHSNYNDTAHSQKDMIWSPHLPIMALLAVNNYGDYSLYNTVINSFDLGGFSEYIQMGTFYPNVGYGSHAPSFTWTHAAILELMYGLQ